jgi:hypothetical protein
MSGFPVRVTVLDTWDEVHLDAGPGDRVADLKRRALAGAGVRGDADRYAVKYLGAELPENGLTLGEAGVRPNSALIVLSRRRTPVR